MELWDILDKNGIKTGRTIIRGQTLHPDDFHLAVHIWIQDEQENYLIQQRALHLKSDPGIWATTVGHVLAGEESASAARRETAEELGLELPVESFHKMSRVTTGQLIQDIYFVNVRTKEEIKLLPGDEVAAVKWASQIEINHMINQGLFFPYSYMSDMILTNI